MIIDKEKAKQALAVLEQEKQEQKQRLLLAADAKCRLDNQSFTTANSDTYGVILCK